MILVHILRDGVVLVPPFPAPSISKLLHAGSVQPADRFWHEGMTDWQLVSTRWEADAGTAPAIPNPAPVSSARFNPGPTQSAPFNSSRRDRPSLLSEAKRRYHETLAPWAQTPAAASVAP